MNRNSRKLVMPVGISSILPATGVALLFIIGTANAGWTSSTKITNLYPTQNTLTFLTEVSIPGSTCDGGRRFHLPMSDPNYEVLSSALLGLQGVEPN